MRLTSEERRIADDVAWRWWCTLHNLDDAWARALEYIAARRKALGEMETLGTAPTVPLERWSSLVDKVEQVADDICGVGSGVTVDGKPEDWLDAIAREHHRLRIEAARRDKPGTATDAGAGAPTAEAGSEKVVAWYVDGLAYNMPLEHRVHEHSGNAEWQAARCGGTVVPLVRQGSQRGVMVTEEQREALALALREAYRSDWGGGVSFELYSLLAAIDAAKGGEA